MRKGVVVVALLFVSLLATAGTTAAVEKNNGENIVKTLITRIDAFQKEINHLQVVVAAVLKKDSVPENLRDVLAVFPEQLNVMSLAMESMRKEIKSDSVQLVSDSSLNRERSITSELLSKMEESLQEMRKSLQEIGNLYTI